MTRARLVTLTAALMCACARDVPDVVTGPAAPEPAEAPPPEQSERDVDAIIQARNVERDNARARELAELAAHEQRSHEEGPASHYADMLAGNRTASGEPYQPELRTCAHPWQPFGTLLEVTATQTGKRCTCRVNDRGPWVKGRVIDVSRKCAQELGMVGKGLTMVRVRPQRS